MKDYLTRALAPYSSDAPDFFYHDLSALNEDGVAVVVCSDGLYKAVADEAILAEMVSHETLEEALGSLVRQAEANGSNDNISIAAMEIGRFARKLSDGISETTVSFATKRKRMKTGRTFFWLAAVLAACALILSFVMHRR